MTLPLHRWCALLFLCVTPITASAEDLALVLSDSAYGGEARHGAAVQALEDAGYQVFEGVDLDRDRIAALSVRLEAVLSGADRLVVHLTGRMENAAGLSVLMPFGDDGTATAELLTEGVPLALFLDMAAARPGQSVVALGSADTPDLAMDVPQGVLVMRGAAADIDAVLARQMLVANRPATEIDSTAAGISLDGLVTPMLRLGAATPAPAPLVAGSPSAIEAALALGLAQRAEVQQDLQVMGYDPGGVDGVFGPGTRSAIRAFQAAGGLTVTGYLTGPQYAAISETAAARRAAANQAEQERTAWDVAREIDTLESYAAFLESWGDGRFAARARDRVETLEAAAETAERVARYRTSEQSLGLTSASVAILERRLGAQGFDAGPADGRIDRQTRRSIAAFQARIGLTSTGYFNTATVQRLIIAGDG